MKKPYGVHWFRRDLRIPGNRALQDLFKQYNGRVVGIFCFDKSFLSRDDFSVNRFQFFLETLVELKKDLRKCGSDLLVLDEGPLTAFPDFFEHLKKNKIALPDKVTFSRDYEPFARNRDSKAKELFEEYGVETETFRDHLVIEPHELSKPSGRGTYQVYSPFARRWMDILVNEKTVKSRVSSMNKANAFLKELAKGRHEKIFNLKWNHIVQKGFLEKDVLDIYVEANKKKTTVEIPKAGMKSALETLELFKKKLDSYSEKRDFPALEGTSKISTFMKNGTLTSALVINFLNLKPYKDKKTSQDTYYSELIWREFYYHILYHHPEVEKKSFNPKYEGLKWMNSKKYFEAWKNGRTGFPIVDAAMRELKSTGLMHNRSRMIVASFLTKDLLIDWRWGEEYFMNTLLDGDLAPNNGGWQWAASTGCDPQPYFRIFNPWSQSKKFDPNGEYIKKYVPELEDIDPKKLHSPIENHPKYPKPIVEHGQQRKKALELYKSV